jgi:hypothetical protein
MAPGASPNAVSKEGVRGPVSLASAGSVRTLPATVYAVTVRTTVAREMSGQ